MDPVLSLVMHEVLPTEILEMIFEEHAILEWEAPRIDGRVCRLWRRIVLNTPRAWARLEIRNGSVPSMDEVRLRLHRSNPAPLHIDIPAEQDACDRLYNLFNDHHTRIVSLRMRYGSQSFFEKRDFPCMRLLDVAHWCPVRWGSMPKLQSLLLGPQLLGLRVVPLSELSPLEMLSPPDIKSKSALRQSQSLTKLILTNRFPADAISGPLTFPSLTYLSIFGAWCSKPRINAPRLVTYHEVSVISGESLNISLPSLVEYGVYHPNARNSDPSKLHLSFPNIQRLAIRADETVLLSFFASLADQPHLLPALQTMSAGAGGRRGRTYYISEVVQEKIESLVLVRNEACAANVILYFETVPPFRIPIFFGMTPDLTY